MEFADPLALVLLALAAPLLWLTLRRRSGAVPVASGAAFAGIRPTLRLRLARALPLIRIIAVLLLVVALARPRVGDTNAVIPGEGIDLVLSLDVSSSMMASLADRRSRLEVMNDVVREFIAGREHDRIGLVMFAREVFTLAPPTLDYAALDRMVEEDVRPGLLPDGTAIGLGLGAAIESLRESTAASRVVILLTDGQNNAGAISPEDAANVASALRIRLYTIGLTDPGPSGESGVDGALLASMAERTGGRYFRASSPEDLEAVYSEIGSLVTSTIRRERYERFTEYAPWLAAAAAALILAEFAASATWLRRQPA